LACGARRGGDAGFRKVAINCSACLYAIRAQYPAEGVTVRTEVVSLADCSHPSLKTWRVR